MNVITEGYLLTKPYRQLTKNNLDNLKGVQIDSIMGEYIIDKSEYDIRVYVSLE